MCSWTTHQSQRKELKPKEKCTFERCYAACCDLEIVWLLDNFRHRHSAVVTIRPLKAVILVFQVFCVLFEGLILQRMWLLSLTYSV